MDKLERIAPRGRRLKGLDEFETPAFLGRMNRVQRRRRLAWLGMLLVATVVGAALGMLLF